MTMRISNIFANVSFKNAAILSMIIMAVSCQAPQEQSLNKIQKISESEIIAAQKAWSVSLAGIGNAYKNGGDYNAAALKHVERFYGFDMGKVLFKATNADEKPFRTTLEGVVSHLIADNKSFPQDEGFARNYWQEVRWNNTGIINGDDNIAIAMGKYFFRDIDGQELVKDYTVCYKKDSKGDLKLIAHKSSLPCDNDI